MIETPWWHEFGKIVLGAGMGTAIVNLAVKIWENRSAKKVALRTVALQFAPKYEQFAEHCLQLCESNRNAVHLPDEEFPEWDHTFPKPPPYDGNASSWAVTPDEIASAASSFDRTVVKYELAVSYTHDMADADVANTIFHDRCVELGIMALEIGENLRSAAKLPALDSNQQLKTALNSQKMAAN